MQQTDAPQNQTLKKRLDPLTEGVEESSEEEKNKNETNNDNNIGKTEIVEKESGAIFRAKKVLRIKKCKIQEDNSQLKLKRH